MFDERTKLLFGDNLSNLKEKNILVVGIGGVGGYVCESLVRTGIKSITIVDYDKVDVTNINRQLIALNSSIGQYKVDVMKIRLQDIDKNCIIYSQNKMLTRDNVADIFDKKYDYVVDAIDMVNAKVSLIKYCYDNEIPCISAMGAGNKTSIPHYQVLDVYKTYNDGLAKVMRKRLRDEGVKNHLVVSSLEKSISNDSKSIGSIMYHPAMCGLVISAHIINDLVLKGENNESNK